MSAIDRMKAGLCIACGKPLPPDNEYSGVCSECATPEHIEERIHAMPEPLRSTLLNVGRRIGFLPPGGTDGS